MHSSCQHLYQPENPEIIEEGMFTQLQMDGYFRIYEQVFQR